MKARVKTPAQKANPLYSQYAKVLFCETAVEVLYRWGWGMKKRIPLFVEELHKLDAYYQESCIATRWRTKNGAMLDAIRDDAMKNLHYHYEKRWTSGWKREGGEAEDYMYLLCLTVFHNCFDKPSQSNKNDKNGNPEVSVEFKRFLNDMNDRISYLNRNFCGSDCADIDNASVMRDKLISYGIPEDFIYKKILKW